MTWPIRYCLLKSEGASAASIRRKPNRSK